jgi:hypothetical protein
MVEITRGRVVLSVFALVAIVAASMWGLPVYDVWRQSLAGDAGATSLRTKRREA